METQQVCFREFGKGYTYISCIKYILTNPDRNLRRSSQIHLLARLQCISEHAKYIHIATAGRKIDQDSIVEF
jgi:hypothetical protein